MIRVGFVIDLSEDWLGGINYFRNLLIAIQSLPNKKIEPVIFTGQRVDLGLFKDFPSVEIAHSSLLDRFRVIRFGYRRLFSYDWFLERLLKKHNINLSSHSGYLGLNAKIPVIGWIPDFQHIRLPKFFSQKEIAQRNRNFKRTCRFCSCVILSSYSAQKDLAKFAPSYVSKSRVLQFVDGFASTLEAPSLEELEDRYKFQEPYFYVPNQFWKHKNHRVIIDALNILKSSNRKVLVLATGATTDYRNPEHFTSLMAYAEQRNVLDCFKVLGFVPYVDLIGLMRYSVSLVNPSLFEGWSTTVEEAKSLGKRIILSEIPVHLEQAPEGGVFFDPRNPQELADTMWRLYTSRDLEKDQELMRRSSETLSDRQNNFAMKYEEIVLSVINRQTI